MRCSIAPSPQETDSGSTRVRTLNWMGFHAAVVIAAALVIVLTTTPTTKKPAAETFRAYTVGLLGAKGGLIKNIVDAYILAPGQNIEQEEDAHMILAHVITRYMRQVTHLYARTEPDGLSLSSQQIGVS